MILKNMLTKDVNHHRYILTDSVCMKSSSRKSQSVMREVRTWFPRIDELIWKGTRGKIVVIEMFYILHWLLVTWLDTIVKKHKTEHYDLHFFFLSAHFIVWKLHLNFTRRGWEPEYEPRKRIPKICFIHCNGYLLRPCYRAGTVPGAGDNDK